MSTTHIKSLLLLFGFIQQINMHIATVYVQEVTIRRPCSHINTFDVKSSKRHLEASLDTSHTGGEGDRRWWCPVLLSLTIKEGTGGVTCVNLCPSIRLISGVSEAFFAPQIPIFAIAGVRPSPLRAAQVRPSSTWTRILRQGSFDRPAHDHKNLSSFPFLAPGFSKEPQ